MSEKQVWNAWERERKRKPRETIKGQKLAVRLSNVIDEWSKSRAVTGKITKADLFAHWNEIVGDTVAQQAEPLQLEKGRLVLKVENSSWRNELLYMRRELIGKINRFLEKKVVKEIIFSG